MTGTGTVWTGGDRHDRRDVSVAVVVGGGHWADIGWRDIPRCSLCLVGSVWWRTGRQDVFDGVSVGDRAFWLGDRHRHGQSWMVVVLVFLVDGRRRRDAFHCLLSGQT